MFGIGKQPAPLFDRLTAITQLHVQQIVEDRNEADKRVKVISFLSMICSGQFLNSTCPRMPTVIRSINRDVLAFEALAFSIYAVREAYSPINAEISQDMDDEEDDYIDVDRRAANDAFKGSATVCAGAIKRYTGWDTDSVLTSRLMNYHHAPTIAGQEGAVERFRPLLLSIGKSKTPQIRYGPPSLDLSATMESMAAMQAFASTIPYGCAETLRGIEQEFGLI